MEGGRQPHGGLAKTLSGGRLADDPTLVEIGVQTNAASDSDFAESTRPTRSRTRPLARRWPSDKTRAHLVARAGTVAGAATRSRARSLPAQTKAGGCGGSRGDAYDDLGLGSLNDRSRRWIWQRLYGRLGRDVNPRRRGGRASPGRRSGRRWRWRRRAHRLDQFDIDGRGSRSQWRHRHAIQPHHGEQTRMQQYDACDDSQIAPSIRRKPVMENRGSGRRHGGEFILQGREGP